MIDDFESLKRQVAEVQSKKDRAAGALQQILSRLKKEFGCKTLQEAEGLLIQKQKDERVAAETYTRKKMKFEKRFKQKLEELE